MGTNRGHYVIYLQNMKFVQLILWPGGAYTDNTYTTTAAITIPYYDSFHESRVYRLIMAMPNEPKVTGSTEIAAGFLASLSCLKPLIFSTEQKHGCCYIFNLSQAVLHHLRSLWCCSDTMDTLGPFWVLAPLIIGLEP